MSTVRTNYIKRMKCESGERAHVSITIIKCRKNMRDYKVLLLFSQISLHEEVAAQLQVASQHFLSEWALFDAASHQPLVEIDTRPKNRRKIAEVGCRAIDTELSII